MAKRRKTVIELTENQLADILTCVGYAIDKGIGYGHITTSEENLLEANRIRLEAKLKNALANFPSVHTKP
jgi:hypothetical protein